jgi:phage head maturation protease
VEGLLNLAVQRGREADALMREGGLDGLSIGFRTVRASPQRGGLRRLLAVDLWEISLVTFPLLPGARAAAQGGTVAPLAMELRAFARRLAPRGAPSARPAAVSAFTLPHVAQPERLA